MSATQPIGNAGTPPLPEVLHLPAEPYTNIFTMHPADHTHDSMFQGALPVAVVVVVVVVAEAVAP